MDALCKLALRLPNIELQINLEYHAARSVYRAHVFQKINVGLPRTSATGSSYRTIESHVCVYLRRKYAAKKRHTSKDSAMGEARIRKLR